jgi:hypothetical protein
MDSQSVPKEDVDHPNSEGINSQRTKKKEKLLMMKLLR